MRRIICICVTSLALTAGGTALATEPDNTGINARDQDSGALTVFDQGESEGDRKITASIREMVVADDSLSTNGQNVKIITIAGVVTLRGPVASPAEKSSIETKAKSVAGVTSVKNQLDVAAN